MCGNCFRIKVCNRFAPNKVAVKCGICKECRKIEQNSWSFRLRCELEDCHNKGWCIGFLTLTYSNENLPHIPMDLADLSKTRDYDCVGFPCFNKSQVRDFVVSLRKKLYDDYGIGKNKDGIKYLIASEFGKNTKRPHYHMVLSWPPFLDAEKMLSIIKEKWTFGHIFPRHYLGGVDSHGYRHLPFEVTSNPFGACKYIAKYISKDLYFFDSLKNFYPIENADLSNYFPFHLQSKSLGFSRLVGLSDEQKLDYILKGFSFIGEDKLIPIPLYFKRKLLFNPDYQVEREVFQDSRKVTDYDESLSDDVLSSLGFEVHYRRLVRREATQFFKDNYEAIYHKQHEVYSKLFENALDPVFLVSKGIEKKVASDFVGFLTQSPWLDSPSKLATAYLCYHGLSIDKCFDIEAPLQWFLRYDSHSNIDTSSFSFFRIDADFYDEVKTFVPLVLALCCSMKVDYSLQDKIADSVAEFWKSAIY